MIYTIIHVNMFIFIPDQYIMYIDDCYHAFIYAVRMFIKNACFGSYMQMRIYSTSGIIDAGSNTRVIRATFARRT